MNYKKAMQIILDRLNVLESTQVYDTDSLISLQQSIQYNLDLLNKYRYLDYNNIVQNQQFKIHNVVDGEDLFRLADSFYNTYEAAETIILNNDINDIWLTPPMTLKVY
jgi:hypothetical protein